jgi:hypothetical protein
MTSIWGRDELAWARLVDTAYEIVIEQCRLGRLIDYSELSLMLHERTGEEPFRFEFERDKAAIGQLLYEVAERGRADHPELDIVLSAAVVLKGQDGPGDGFFRYARDRGYIASAKTPDERIAFWLSQWSKCQVAYALAP